MEGDNEIQRFSTRQHCSWLFISDGCGREEYARKVSIIDFPVKEFEIWKWLFARYKLDSGERVGDYTDVRSYAYLSVVLSKIFIRTYNLKHLKALLMINDTVASMIHTGYVPRDAVFLLLPVFGLKVMHLNRLMAERHG